MDKQTRESASQLFGALSHPTRIRIVELLERGEQSVNEIADALGIGQSGTSQHLAILSRTGVLAVEQRGASRYYRLRGPRIPQILVLIQEFCEVHKLQGQAEDEES